ncbi:hypothetical protein [Bradyrhizobium sp. 174]|uniref:hypothetical protein n=1 Tax=Bradyrhizobium sp. 174 TaxID=2782645 RepID=UPI001FF7F94C|nr:hypothetical protein [Bradyrhizobium sp. 174]MCK1577839.1 hypothetical protein [Bradyrhizobium sp. 174]
MKEMPNLPEARCACWSPEDRKDVGCVCGDSERVLRAIQRGEIRLTDEQREWCLGQIETVEGYSRSQYTIADDGTLAQGVICAWTDYARDKGLL